MGRVAKKRWTRRLTALTLAISTAACNQLVSVAGSFAYSPDQSTVGCADGQCNTPTQPHGYYRPSWRRWPGAASLSPGQEAPPAGVPDVKPPDARDELSTRPRSRSNEPLESDLDVGPAVPSPKNEAAPNGGDAESLPLPGAGSGGVGGNGVDANGLGGRATTPAVEDDNGFDFGPLGSDTPNLGEPNQTPATPPLGNGIGSGSPGLPPTTPNEVPPTDDGDSGAINFDDIFGPQGRDTRRPANLRVARRTSPTGLELGGPANRADDLPGDVLPNEFSRDAIEDNVFPNGFPSDNLPGVTHERSLDLPPADGLPASWSPTSSVPSSTFEQPTALPADFLQQAAAGEAAPETRNPLRREPQFRLPTNESKNVHRSSSSEITSIRQDEPTVNDTLEAFAAMDPREAFATKDRAVNRSTHSFGNRSDNRATEIAPAAHFQNSTRRPAIDDAIDTTYHDAVSAEKRNASSNNRTNPLRN